MVDEVVAPPSVDGVCVTFLTTLVVLTFFSGSFVCPLVVIPGVVVVVVVVVEPTVAPEPSSAAPLLGGTDVPEQAEMVPGGDEQAQAEAQAAGWRAARWR